MSYRSVLFVDDDAIVAQAFARSTRDLDLDVDVVDHPGAALSAAAHKAYGVVISDYQMDAMTGLELIDRLRTDLPEAVYVLASASCDFRLAAAAVNRHGVRFLLAKPWDGTELAELLRQATALAEQRGREPSALRRCG